MRKPDWGIPALDPTRLATTIPTRVYGGGPIDDPAHSLFLWRTCKTEKATGATLAFFLSDEKIERIWRAPARYAKEFAACGIKAIVEIDYSVWAGDGLLTQVANIRRTRVTSRVFQGHELSIIPNLNWSDERSYEFCFSGLPVGAPVCMTECRTAGQNDHDRRLFLRGLARAVEVLEPQHIVIFGGLEHKFWLAEHLPHGPQYTLLEAFMTARSRIRAAHEQELKNQNQLNLPIGGSSKWADAEHMRNDEEKAGGIKEQRKASPAIRAATNSLHCR